MRRPLRQQIMLPMAGIMLATVLLLGGLCAILAVRSTKSRIEDRIAGVTQILQGSNFPLTDAVLRQMKALSGAELLVLDDRGKVVATSGAARQFLSLLAPQPVSRPPGSAISLGDHLWTRSGGYFHTAVSLSGRRPADRAAALHILYPEQDYRRAWQHAVYPSLAFVALAVPAVMVLAGWTAARIGRRMSRLQAQVDRIAQGDFQQIELTDRDDEIRALGQSVNRMAEMLSRYEEDVRRTERTRTLARLGAGIAHQLRNSATGCRIALDLHSEQCGPEPQCECLDVARNQLRLMEQYIRRFLLLGDTAQDRPTTEIDLAALIDELVPLLRPAARHAGIALDWQPPAHRCAVMGDSAALSQLVINLLDNAIAATAQNHLHQTDEGRVAIELCRRSAGSIRLIVSDTGMGPADELGDRLFEPFVTTKPDGVGLGLAVARDVARQHAGHISWQRSGGFTQFCVDLPAILPAGLQPDQSEMELQIA